MVQQRHAARAAVDGSRPGQAAGQDASGSGRAGAKRGRVGHTARHEFFVHAGRCGLHASGAHACGLQPASHSLLAISVGGSCATFDSRGLWACLCCCMLRA
eukprot:292924-Chlamydomonas_euryale.AAC.2